MTKITLTDLVSLQNETTAVNAINDNNAVLESALDNTISRDGTSPNQMTANLDMNSNHILNLPAPISADEPVRLTDIQDLTAGGTIVFNSIPTGGTVGQALIKNSSSNFDVSWKNPTTTVTPEMFGAISATYGTAVASVPDSTNAFRAALTALSNAGGGILQLGNGVYKLTAGITITHNSTFIKGLGEKVTTILFQPSGTDSAIAVSALTPGTISYTGISDLSISSADTTVGKNAINLTDVSNFYLDRVTINSYPAGNLWSGGGSSVGLRINGRELGYVTNFYSAADIPLLIDVNPNFAPISMDSWVFEDCNFVGHFDTISTNPCILVNDKTNITNVSFCGSQNWQGGTDGFRWINSTAVAVSINVNFSGVKSEQCPLAVAGVSSWMFNIQTNQSVRGMQIKNCLGGDRNGIYLRGVVNPIISNMIYDASTLTNGMGLNVDSSAGTLTIEGCTWLTTTTASITGLTAIQTSDTPAGLFLSTAIPPRAFYSTKTTETFNNTVISGTETVLGTLNPNTLNVTGSTTLYNTTPVPSGGTAGTGIKLGNTFTNFGIFFGSGAPTLSAAQGSLYIRSDGSSTSTRLYVNSNGTTGWTNVTTAV